MATQLPPSQRTQGDGMEKAENETLNEQTVMLKPQDIKDVSVCDGMCEKSSTSRNIIKNLGLAIKLTPQAVNRQKKDVLSNLKSKEPKFVPYEPYKAAVRPIIPPCKKILIHGGKKKSKEPSNVFKTHATEEQTDKSEKLSEEIINKESKELHEINWEDKSKTLELEIQTLREENEQLENQLKFQVQVNSELKNLLVAAVGEDMETKVHVLTEDKLHLAQALLNSAESLNTHQEQTEWLAGQCEVWRSKFLASSVMVEELARWKASLSQKINEAHDAIKRLLEEKKQIRDCLVNTNKNLCQLRDNFDLHNRKNTLNTYDDVEVSVENLKLSKILLQELLGSEKRPISTSISNLDFSKKSAAEKFAEHVLANPNILQIIGEPDAACNAVVGAAVTLSGQLYLQSHPPKIKCCPRCSGEIKLI